MFFNLSVGKLEFFDAVVIDFDGYFDRMCCSTAAVPSSACALHKESHSHVGNCSCDHRNNCNCSAFWKAGH